MKYPFVFGALLLLSQITAASVHGEIDDAFATGDELNYNTVVFELKNADATDRLEIFENGTLAHTAYNPKSRKIDIEAASAKCRSLEEDKPFSANECRIRSQNRVLKRSFDYDISLSENNNLRIGENMLKLVFYNLDGTESVRFFSFALNGTIEKRKNYSIQKDILERDIDFSKIIRVADVLTENYPELLQTLVISDQGNVYSNSSAKPYSKSITISAEDEQPWTVMVHEFSHLYWEEKLSGKEKRAYKVLYDRLVAMRVANEALLSFKESSYIENGGGHPQSNEAEMYASMTTLMHVKKVEVLENVHKLPLEAQSVIGEMYKFIPKYRGI